MWPVHARERITIRPVPLVCVPQINRAKGEAEAIRLNAQATSDGIKMLAQQLMSEGGREAVSLRVAESYIAAFSKLAKSSTTLLMPSNAGDPSAMVRRSDDGWTDDDDGLMRHVDITIFRCL